jgi:hypothetical protein
MMDLYRVLTAEGLKLQRTLALRLAICCPTIIVLLVFGTYVPRVEKFSCTNPLIGFAQFILTIWTIIMFPLYAALAAALLDAIEYQSETWKQLFALPIHRATIFLAKWITGTGLLLLSSVALAVGVSLAAEILRLVKPVWRTFPLPCAMIFRGALLSFCAAGFLFSIQMWISLRWRNFLPGLVVGVIALVLMFIALPHGAGVFGNLFPWSLPAMAMSPHNIHRPFAVGLGFLGGIVVSAVACFDLSRREFC